MKLLPLIVSSLLLAACGGTQKSSTTATTTTQQAEPVGPAFSADSAFAFCQQQCDFGPRTMNSEAHEQCREWIVDKFRQYGLTVEQQHADLMGYDGTVLHATNIALNVTTLDVENTEYGSTLLSNTLMWSQTSYTILPEDNTDVARVRTMWEVESTSAEETPLLSWSENGDRMSTRLNSSH